MDAQKKRSLKDLFQDKRFLWIIPVFLVLVGGFLWVIASNPSTEQPVETASTINTNVPAAKTDSTLSNTNKLDLQTESVGENPQIEGMQGVPGTEKYVYGTKYNPTAGRSAPEQIAPVYENPTASSEKGSMALPTTINRRSSSNRSSSSSFPLTEADGRLEDDEDEPVTSPQQAKVRAQNKAQLQMALDKQAQLDKLLGEYKRDKQLKEAKENDKTKALKVLTDDEGRIGVPITSLNGRDNSRNSFYGLYTEDARKAQQRLLDAEVGTIRAMVYGDQEITGMGSRIKIRLLDPLYVRGIIIPANTLLYGMGQFAGQRVNLLILSIQYQNRLFPVNIQVYDMDGMAGLYVPNMTNLDLAKQTAAQVAQGGGGGSMAGSVYLNSSPGAIAASAGLQAGQQIVQGVKQGLARKAQIQRAYLKNNYYVLLRTVEQGGTNSGASEQATSSSPLTEKQMQLQMLQNILKEQ